MVKYKKKKLKILHIGNGKAFKIKAIISFFRDRGHEIHFIPMPPTEARWEGIVYHSLQRFGRFSKLQVLRNIFSIRRIVKSIEPDIIHCHNARGPGWYGAFSGRHPFLIHAYGGDILPARYQKKDYFPKIMTKYTCRKLDMMIVTGTHMIKGASHLKIQEDKIKVIPRGVNLKNYRMGLETSNLREKLNIDNSAPIIFSPRYQVNQALYNFDTIIESIHIVRKDFPNVVFIQLFDQCREKERVKLEKIAKDMRVLENYKMVKAVDNEQMPYFYNLADIMVSVPSTDGFPVSVLEASACGTPMIVTKLNYTAEWFVDGRNGILIPVRDHEKLAGAVVKLLKDKSLCENMIEINRKQVEEKADYENCMLELEHLYYELIDRLYGII